MQGNQRRGRRPKATAFVSQRRIPGGRELLFASTSKEPERDARSNTALQTARAFSWGDDVPAANDPTAPVPAANDPAVDDPGQTMGQPARVSDHDYAQFLKGLRGVYRAPRRPR